MHANEYRLMEEAVEAGIHYGWNRAHKHTDDPQPTAIQEAILQAVMGEVCERFIFDNPLDE